MYSTNRICAAAALAFIGGILAMAQVRSAGSTPKASYFAAAELQKIWTDLETRQVINQRVVEGGAYSINIRIVRPGDAPLVHAHSADIWIAMDGAATAVTGGQLLDGKKRGTTDDMAGSGIANGTEQPLKPGDIVFVPAGVPHGFKNVKGFRAYLIRFDTN